MERILLFRTLMLFGFLTGCAAEEEAVSSRFITAAGWSINPSGDLNGFFDCLEEEGAAIVSAHRGGPAAGFPENALETIAHTLASTPAIVEIDIATSSDGVLYLMHDDDLARTTNGSGPADGISWNEVTKLRLRDRNGQTTEFAPPRLDDVLVWAEGRTVLQLDIKRSTRYEDVADAVSKAGAKTRVILIAYSLAQAQKLHRLMPETMISLSVNAMSDLNRAVAAGVPDDRLLGFTGTESPRPRLFSILDSRDVEVIFGTLGHDGIDQDIARSGENNQYADIAAMGVDIIATDRPLAAYAALKEAGRAPQEGACGISKSPSQPDEA